MARNRQGLTRPRRLSRSVLGRPRSGEPVYVRGWGANVLGPTEAPGDMPVDSANAFYTAGGWVRQQRISKTVRLNDGRLARFTIGLDAPLDYQLAAIFVKFSTDEGRSWSVAQLVYRKSDYASNSKWLNGPVVPVVHAPSGNVIIFFSESTGASGSQVHTAFYIYSTDNCVTWSAKVSTPNVIKVNNSSPATLPACYKLTNAAWVWMVPTDGICLKGGANAGRIIVAADHRYTVGATAYAGLYYMDGASDPATATVELAGGYDESVAGNDNANETSITEIGSPPGGTIHMSNRLEGGANTGRRGQATIVDHTTTFGPLSLMTDGTANIPVNNCWGSSVTLKNGDILEVLPVNGGVLASSSGDRSRLTLLLSTDNGATFPVSRVLNYSASGYSSIIELANGEFLIHFEVSPNPVAETNAEQYMQQVRVNRAWLTGEAAFPTVHEWWFNEEAAGTVLTQGGTQILDRGNDGQRNYDQRGFGAAGATYDANGLLFAGSGVMPWLQEAEVGANGGALDPGSGSMTYEFEFLAPTGTAVVRYLFDNAVGSTGTPGVSFRLNSTHKATFTVKDTAAHTTSAGSVGTAYTLNDGLWHTFAAVINRTDNTLKLYETTTGTPVLYNISISISTITGPILGGGKFKLGGASDGTLPSAAGTYLRRLRVTRGVKVDGWIKPGEPAPPVSRVVGSAPVCPPAGPASVGSPTIWLGATYDNGFQCRMDGGPAFSAAGAGSGGKYGGFDRPRFPMIRGQGATAYRDLGSSPRLWSFGSMSRGMWLDSDSIVGPHWRHNYDLGANASGPYFLVFPGGTIIDQIQTSNLWSFFALVNFQTDVVSIVIDNSASGSTANGISLIRSVGGALALRIVAGGSLVLAENLSGVTLTAGTWYAICLSGQGSGAGVKFGVASCPGARVAPTIPVLSTTAGTVAVAAGASTLDLALYSRSDVATPANVREKNSLVYAGVGLVRADFQALADFSVRY